MDRYTHDIYIYIYICVCVYVYTYTTYLHTCMLACLRMYVCMYVYVCMPIYLSIYVYPEIRMYGAYIYMCIECSIVLLLQGFLGLLNLDLSQK